MRSLLLVLMGLFVLFQYRLWLGEGSLTHKAALEEQIEQQRQENEELGRRNERLAAEVDGLRDGLQGTEEKARTDLGMVRTGETFYRLVDPDRNTP
ncbi:MAG TPA: cell division protein FtsB [Porticoccaceae bacterium]|nr:cell division protein FtsB [Porticoccaceae bacterium]